MIRIAAALLCAAQLAACGEPQVPPVIPPVPMPEPKVAAAPTPGPIPLDFRHVWAIEAKDCTAAPGLTRIAIAPGAIRFYEGRSVVTDADVAQDGSLKLNVQHAAEGQTSEETHTLKLDATGHTLTYRRRDATFTYTRCG